MRRLPLLAACAALAILAGACVSGEDIAAIQSQLSDIQRQVLTLQQQSSSKQEVEELQSQIASQTQALIKSEADVQVALRDLSTMIDQLQANLEDTNFRLSQLSQQIAATNQELNSVRSLLGGSGLAPTSGGGGTPAPSQASDPQALYQSAYNDYLRGNYDLAVRGFGEYLRAFPDTEQSDNAAYWIGECYFSQGRYRQAIGEFDQMLNRYPRSDKLASALLKKGYAYLELNQREQGVVQLQHVLRQYPGTDEANLARQRLREVGVDVR